MDDIDMSIIRSLERDGRASQAQIANWLGLSRQTIAERMLRMRENGTIIGYAPLVSAQAVGADLMAFIGVTVDRPEQCAAFVEAIQAMAEVQECHHIAGDDSYLLKVRTAGTRGLEQLISHQLKCIPGVVRTHTTVVLSTAKETPIPPMLRHD